MLMQGARAFIGSGLSVVAWGGNKGDSYFAKTPRAMKRSEYASSSIIIAGSFKMTEVPEDDKLENWPLIKAGQMCALLLPDFKKGNYTWVCQEDGSLEYCVGTVTPAGGPDYQQFESKPVTGGSLQLVKGSILIVAIGKATVEGEDFVSGDIIHAKNRDVSVVLSGDHRGMMCRRIT